MTSSAPTFNNPTDTASSDTLGTSQTYREESVELFANRQDRETTVTQDVPVRVLAPASIEGLHEPQCRDPDVHLTLPNLLQLKGISDRFTRLAATSKPTRNTGFNSAGSGPKLELSGNMHGCLRLTLQTDTMKISSLWTGLENPELDPSQIPEGEEGVAAHPTTRMKALGDATGQSEEGWATVRVEGRDWGRVLSVGRLGGKVIACFCDEHALVLYVYVNSDEPGMGESVFTVSRSSRIHCVELIG
jgi:HUS1 checkpoint protein